MFLMVLSFSVLFQFFFTSGFIFSNIIVILSDIFASIKFANSVASCCAGCVCCAGCGAGCGASCCAGCGDGSDAGCCADCDIYI